MSAIAWKDEYNTGIKVIDEQHLRIVDYINELYNVRENGGNAKSVLKALIDYTLTHFTFEESLHERANYRDIEEHKRHHVVFINKIARFKDRFDQVEDVLLALLSCSNSGWLPTFNQNTWAMSAS
ncbi:hypothetical protein AUK40_00665 [Candidatus Wirthbacteria bacterium CG2_30_54_11]|uniref:Hemerythrin-like domain-containing protein n=1 Tax=Candidatus Wirthbacteria bacterium CG2_30_54_11 TaxID=1817892 RepID=A0A1J5J204_9BACT|nr:MAG: hypothetical protein AUK40_00665 [Candidatus Wirthbacteria bacterium CG2_30_54_11]